MNGKKIRDFTSGSITPQLISFAWPLFLSNLLQTVYNMVDMVVVGNVLGKTGLSAVAVGGDVSHFLTFIAMGFSSAGQVLIARLIGSGKREQLGRFVGTMAGFLGLCSLVLSAVAITFQNGILKLMNTPSESFGGAAAYSLICMVGLVFIYGYNTVSAVLRGMGDSKRPFIFISIAAVLNLILDIVLVAKVGMGPAGAALATVISQGLSFLLCTVFLARHRQDYMLDIKLRDFVFWDRNHLSSLVKLGTPMAIKSASVQVSKLFVNSWINSYGVAVSGFAGIANKITTMSNLIASSMNTAGSTMIGQNLAAGKLQRVKKILGTLILITLSVAGTMIAALLMFPNEIFSLFTSDPEVLAILPGYIGIAVLQFLSAPLRSSMNALINGSGNHRINFVTAILDGIVMRIGLALLLGLALDMRHYGFWLGDALASFTPFFVGLGFYLSGRWKKGVE